jgi:2-amino-4-hydroxy-6-hydroxymethyldihydropteridine diphosphokinase
MASRANVPRRPIAVLAFRALRARHKRFILLLQAALDMIVVALGSNLPSEAGGPRETLRAALDRLAARGAHIDAISPFYETPAWPDPSDPRYLNAVACVRSDLPPRELMALLQEIETSLGRTRSRRNAPRTLDLDLIDYDGRVEKGPPVLPHPRVRSRAFVLQPLFDIAPDWRHPVSGEPIADLLAALQNGVNEIVRVD